MKTIEISALPSAPILAAETFFRDHFCQVSAHFDTKTHDIALVLPPAETDHDDWRRSAARDLARKFAPARVNIIGGGGDAAREETLAYLRDAPGITGQYLPLA